jgi:hypothetical protein
MAQSLGSGHAAATSEAGGTPAANGLLLPSALDHETNQRPPLTQRGAKRRCTRRAARRRAGGAQGATVVAQARWQTRSFPPPWSVEERDACFIVSDKNGQALAYVYFEEEPGRRAAASALPPPRRFRAC